MVPDVNQILVKGKGIFVNPEVRTAQPGQPSPGQHSPIKLSIYRSIDRSRNQSVTDNQPNHPTQSINQPMNQSRKRFLIRRTHPQTPSTTTIPQSPSAKAKLRLLYEVGPIGYLIEKAGGASSYGAGSVLDLKVHKTEDRTQVRPSVHHVLDGWVGGWVGGCEWVV
jgi:hypothetical protein